MLQDRVVHWALDAGLEETVDVDEASQDAVIVGARDIHVAVQNDLTFGQRARLVAAQDRQAPEILDCSKLLD